VATATARCVVYDYKNAQSSPISDALRQGFLDLEKTGSGAPCG